MTSPYLLVAGLLLLIVFAGFVRIMFESGVVARLLALQLLGSSLVAIIILLAHAVQWPVLLDIAVVTGLLASILSVAFIRYGGVSHRRDTP